MSAIGRDHPQMPYMNPKVMPDSETIAPTERSMPPRPEVMTKSCAKPSIAMGTALISAEAM